MNKSENDLVIQKNNLIYDKVVREHGISSHASL